MDTMPSSGVFATLTVQHGPLTGRQFPMSQPTITIGRTAGNDLIIDDPEVSRRHARLTWNGQQFLIEDLGSTNGTFVNNVQIHAPRVLSPGDSLRLGALTLAFHSHLQPASGEPITNVSMPALRMVQQPPPSTPAYAPVYAAPAPPRAGSATPWLLALGIGAALVLALIGAGLAFVLLGGLSGGATTTEITSPMSGAQVTVGQETAVLAMASDSHGIARVELWADGRLVDSMLNPSSSPGAFSVQFGWTAAEPGSHLLEVHAYNRDGRSSESASVSVRAVSAVSPTPTSAAVLVLDTPVSTAGPLAGGCTSASAFVADVTIPDYSQVQPGQRFDKIWRVRNSGTCPWGPGYQLAYAGGDQMSAPPSQPVAYTAPGGAADVQVTMYAPGAPGTYTGYWQIRDAAGQPFGSRLTVIIVVPLSGGPPPDTPTPSPPGPGGAGCSPTIDFRADDDVIAAGESTTVRWDVECVREVYFQGEPVTGHESREVGPAGVTVYTLRVVKNDGSSEERRVTVAVTAAGIEPVEPGETSELNVTMEFHSYDQATGTAWFQVSNRSDRLSVSRVDRRIWNYSSNEVYYTGYTLHSFYTSPAPGALGLLPPGQTRYISCALAGEPTGVRCRGEFTFHESGGGDLTATERVDFALPGAPGGGGAINANITYHSYDRTTRWVTLRVVNTGDVTLESAKATFNAPGGPGVLYGPGSSNSPFRDSPTSDDPMDSVAPGGTKYLRYRLREAPSGAAVAATIELHSGEDLGGQSLTRTLGFTLP